MSTGRFVVGCRRKRRRIRGGGGGGVWREGEGGQTNYKM